MFRQRKQLRKKRKWGKCCWGGRESTRNAATGFVMLCCTGWLLSPSLGTFLAVAGSWVCVFPHLPSQDGRDHPSALATKVPCGHSVLNAARCTNLQHGHWQDNHVELAELEKGDFCSNLPSSTPHPHPQSAPPQFPGAESQAKEISPFQKGESSALGAALHCPGSIHVNGGKYCLSVPIDLGGGGMSLRCMFLRLFLLRIAGI